MDNLNNLTKTQVVLLVLLVSFFTSLVTGIVTVTLVNQAPPPVTQTISRVIEKVIPGENYNQVATPIQPVAQDKEALVISVVQKVSPAVVSIVVTKDVPVMEEYYVNVFPGIQIPQYRQKGTEKQKVSSGTGFFVSQDGLILTNKHVVQDTEAEFSVILNDGRKFDAKVLDRDPFQDIAILKIEGDKFNFIPLGNSDAIKIGQSVITIGNALGEFQNTVSTGIISGLNRTIIASGSLSGDEELQQLIQTDAAINSGNSGGPLLNLNGEAIGINTAMAKEAENIGFALAINIAKRDIQDIKEFGMVKYPFIGIRYQLVDASVQKEKNLSVDYGLLISKGISGDVAITKDGPADKVGIKEGDIILEFNGTKLDKSSLLGSLLSKSRVGDKVNLKILRDGKEMSVVVTLGERPESL